MKKSNFRGLCCILSLFAALAGAGTVLAAGQQVAALDPNVEEKETMPVMTGEEWQTMTHESKVAFVWGVGHVVTVEEYVVRRRPELQRSDFVAKLGEGLRGIPMNNIVQTVDNYYQNNPGDRDLPVMRVIWRQIVKPKLKSGIADAPLKDNDQ